MYVPSSFLAALSGSLRHPKPRGPVVSREIGRGGDRQPAVGVANNPVTDVRLRAITVHELSTAVPPVVPDSSNAVGIWIRIIERAVCDPQGFDFTFWSEKLAHRCQTREPYSRQGPPAQRFCSSFLLPGFNWPRRLSSATLLNAAHPATVVSPLCLSRDNLRRTFTIAKITTKQTAVASDATQSTF